MESAGGSGGATGARIGTRHSTQLDAERIDLPATRSQAGVEALDRELFGGRAEISGPSPAGPDDDAVLIVGVIGSGTGRLNPCVVQVVWWRSGLRATAHAREGLIGQGTAGRALARLREALGR